METTAGRTAGLLGVSDTEFRATRDQAQQRAIHEVALHLVMCSACRAFARQVAWLDRSARRPGGALEQDFPAGLEERIQERLTRGEE